jgi:hypothetical protein
MAKETTTQAAEKPLALDIIRETGKDGNWLNRYCQDVETRVRPLYYLSVLIIGHPLLLHYRIEIGVDDS